MDAAPFDHRLAEGPQNAKAYWVNASDGVRLRFAHWPGDGKGNGTVYLFTGRTEFVEKYGRAAQELVVCGYDVIAIDWRGQGASDRLLSARELGHVEEFVDYQLDVDAVVAATEQLNCPEPRYLIAHSMGGGIGLRSLHQGLAVKAAVFSSPMFGRAIPKHLAPLARNFVRLADLLGLGQYRVPGTPKVSYAMTTPFEGNDLTTDLEMFNYMKRQIVAHSDMAIAGPTIRWAEKAYADMEVLTKLPPLDIPALAIVGGNEHVVDSDVTKRLMAEWPNGKYICVPNKEHELMMEDPETRQMFFKAAADHFARYA